MSEVIEYKELKWNRVLKVMKSSTATTVCTSPAVLLIFLILLICSCPLLVQQHHETRAEEDISCCFSQKRPFLGSIRPEKPKTNCHNWQLIGHWGKIKNCRRYDDIMSNDCLFKTISLKFVFEQNHSFHISDEEDNEDAAEQRHGRSREDHHDHTSCCVDQSTEPHAHDDLSQLDHASEGGTVHSRTSRTFIASMQLQLLLEAQEVVGY